MASNVGQRRGLLTTGGILSIVGGALEMIFGAVVTALTVSGDIPGVFQLPWRPGHPFEIDIMPSFTMLGVPLLVLGIIAVVGGISALRRESFGLSLVGAICALPSAILGMLAVIFVALGKSEFGAERKEMASNGNGRGKLLTAGGILSIVGGISQIICSGWMIVVFVVPYPLFTFNLRPIYALFLPGLPDAWAHYVLWGNGPGFFPMEHPPVRWAIIGGCLGVLGIVAVVGGVSAIRRKSVGLSLTGAICALPSVFVGILAVIFVALGKREFGVERKENGI